MYKCMCITSEYEVAFVIIDSDSNSGGGGSHYRRTLRSTYAKNKHL